MDSTDLKVLGIQVAVGAVAVLPIPGSCAVANELGTKWLSNAKLATPENLRTIKATALTWDLVGKGTALAILSTLVALGVITGPVGIIGIFILAVCILCVLLPLIFTVKEIIEAPPPLPSSIAEANRRADAALRARHAC